MFQPQQHDDSSHLNVSPYEVGPMTSLEFESWTVIDEEYPNGFSGTVSPHNAVRADHCFVEAEDAYFRFLLYHHTEDLEAALKGYRRTLAAHPNHAGAYVGLAKSLMEKGEIDCELALRYCQMAYEADSTFAESALHRGYFLKQSGKMNQAISWFEKAISLSPLKMPKARLALSVALLQSTGKRFNHGFGARLSRVVKSVYHGVVGSVTLPLDSRSFRVLQQAVWDDAMLSGINWAVSGYELLGWHQAAARVLGWGHQKYPNEAQIAHRLGDVYLHLGEGQDASLAYEQALALETEAMNRLWAVDMDGADLMKTLEGPETLIAALHRKLAQAYEMGAEIPKAIGSLEKVIELETEDFDSLYKLAQLYVDSQQYIRALYYLKEATRHEPGNPYIHSNMAYVMFKLEDYEGAVHEYRQAIKRGDDPQWVATVAQTLGTIYYKVLGQPDGAMEMFQMAAKLDPHNVQVQTALVDLYTETGDLESAIDIYETIVAQNPDNGDCHTYLGYLLWQLDRNVEAVESYRKAVDLDEANVIALNNLGVIFLDEWHDCEEALNYFQQALSLKPDYTMACFNVGRTLEAYHQTTEAAKYYARALELNQVNPELTEAEIMERIDGLFDLSC